jgi:indole-3-glycerol phosphate synthase
MTILHDILRHKRSELSRAQASVDLNRLLEQGRSQPASRPFAAALRPRRPSDPPRLIAEIKKVSPAKGALNPDMDVRQMATLYEQSGASAISVLTDERFFAGHLDDLRAVRALVTLPILRKDFVISHYQLAEARAAGADAALLIVAALALPLADSTNLAEDISDGEEDLGAAYARLASLLAAARELGIECLVEVHDEAEIDVAVRAGAQIIGINNRNLRTFETTLEITERLAARVPPGAVLVSESGINTADDVRRVRSAGASAVLVGSSIVSAPDPSAKIKELVG